MGENIPNFLYSFQNATSDQARSAKKQNVFDQLWELSNDLSNGKFVKNISIYPALQLTLVHPDMTREFEEMKMFHKFHLIGSFQNIITKAILFKIFNNPQLKSHFNILPGK